MADYVADLVGDVLHIGLGKYIQARKDATRRERCHVGLNKLLGGLPPERSQEEDRTAQPEGIEAG